MKNLIVLSVIGMVAILGGCSDVAKENEALLRKATSVEEVGESMLVGFQKSDSALDYGIGNSFGPETSVMESASASPTTANNSNNFTDSYTLEQGVEEADIIKYNGDYAFIAASWVVPFDQSAQARDFTGLSSRTSILPAVPVQERQARIRILRTNVAQLAAQEISQIQLPENYVTDDIYINGDLLTVILQPNTNYSHWNWHEYQGWQAKEGLVQVYNVENKASPQLVHQIFLNGTIINSRIMNDTLYLFSRYAPDKAALEDNVDNVIPLISINDQDHPLITDDNCYVAADNSGSSIVTSMIAISLVDPEKINSVCFNAQTSGEYISKNAIYLTDVVSLNYPFGTRFSRTQVHKFDLDNLEINYAGSAVVAGSFYGYGHNEFRISEHNGDVRIITTVMDWTNSVDSRDHILYVLRPNPEKKSLEVVGKLPNAERPAEIGKPNENLYGVRFFDDKLFAVTFEQIDPLYVIDLTDPTDPYLAGDLEVTGFSEMLHPVSDELLLGIGVSESRGIKVELFNVADIRSPMSLGAVEIGRWGYSEALFDRHAFTYLPANDDSAVDRFSLPVTANLFTQTNNATYISASGLYNFEIRNINNPSLAYIEQVSVLQTPEVTIGLPENENEGYWGYGERRSIIHDDTIFFLDNNRFYTGTWQEGGIANGPY